jgi:hypothetical protein
MKLHRSNLISELKREFPFLREEINREMGLLHMEVSVFRRFTQQMICEGDRAIVEQCFKIAEKYYLNGNSKMVNAIGVSYIEDLDFTDTKQNYKSWSWGYFPESLKKEYISFHGKPSV